MSQYGEHVKILEYFNGEVGMFLDIGAGSGDALSNTVPLIEAGWRGVLVEPALHQLKWLIDAHGSNERVEIIPAAIQTMKRGPFWESGDYSTLSPIHRTLIHAHSEGQVKFRQRAVVQLSALELFQIVPDAYDFVNIDVEGDNLAVLRSTFNCMARTPFMVCVEMDPAAHIDAMREVLIDAGLTQQEVFGGNLLAWKLK